MCPSTHFISKILKKIQSIYGSSDEDSCVGRAIKNLADSYWGLAKDQNALIDASDIKFILLIKSQMKYGRDSKHRHYFDEYYTDVIDMWVLAKVAADRQVDRERLKQMPELYTMLDFSGMSHQFLCNTVFKRDSHLWDKVGVCSRIVLQEMSKRILKNKDIMQ